MATGLKYALLLLLAGVLSAQTSTPTHRKAGMAPVQQNGQPNNAPTSANPSSTPLARSRPQQPDPAVPPVTSQLEPAATQTAGEKVPPTAPRISFQNNELTVVAQNSSLGEILNAIRAATGMRIEGLGGSADRVTAKIGPAPVRDVLLSLLEGSRYDFAILGSATDPTVVERVVLSARTSGDVNSAATAQQPQPTEPSDSAASDDDDNPGIAPPTATPAQPVKTPEQLLEDLKKLEADRAQQQKNNPTPGDPNAPRTSRPERPK